MSIERPRRLVALTLAAALVAGGVSLLAQRGRGQGRGGGGQMELPPITVNFRALSSDGTPVGDLTAGDLTLKVDGRDRTLDALRLVEFKEGAAPSGEGGSIAPPPPFGPAERSPFWASSSAA